MLGVCRRKFEEVEKEGIKVPKSIKDNIGDNEDLKLLISEVFLRLETSDDRERTEKIYEFFSQSENAKYIKKIYEFFLPLGRKINKSFFGLYNFNLQDIFKIVDFLGIFGNSRILFISSRRDLLRDSLPESVTLCHPKEFKISLCNPNGCYVFLDQIEEDNSYMTEVIESLEDYTTKRKMIYVLFFVNDSRIDVSDVSSNISLNLDILKKNCHKIELDSKLLNLRPFKFKRRELYPASLSQSINIVFLELIKCSNPHIFILFVPDENFINSIVSYINIFSDEGSYNEKERRYLCRDSIILFFECTPVSLGKVDFERRDIYIFDFGIHILDKMNMYSISNREFILQRKVQVFTNLIPNEYLLNTKCYYIFNMEYAGIKRLDNKFHGRARQKDLNRYHPHLLEMVEEYKNSTEYDELYRIFVLYYMFYHIQENTRPSDCTKEFYSDFDWINQTDRDNNLRKINGEFYFLTEKEGKYTENYTLRQIREDLSTVIGRFTNMSLGQLATYSHYENDYFVYVTKDTKENVNVTRSEIEVYCAVDSIIIGRTDLKGGNRIAKLLYAIEKNVKVCRIRVEKRHVQIFFKTMLEYFLRIDEGKFEPLNSEGEYLDTYFDEENSYIYVKAKNYDGIGELISDKIKRVERHISVFPTSLLTVNNICDANMYVELFYNKGKVKYVIHDEIHCYKFNEDTISIFCNLDDNNKRKVRCVLADRQLYHHDFTGEINDNHIRPIEILHESVFIEGSSNIVFLSDEDIKDFEKFKINKLMINSPSESNLHHNSKLKMESDVKKYYMISFDVKHMDKLKNNNYLFIQEDDNISILSETKEIIEEVKKLINDNDSENSVTKVYMKEYLKESSFIKRINSFEYNYIYIQFSKYSDEYTKVLIFSKDNDFGCFEDNYGKNESYIIRTIDSNLLLFEEVRDILVKFDVGELIFNGRYICCTQEVYQALVSRIERMRHAKNQSDLLYTYKPRFHCKCTREGYIYNKTHDVMLIPSSEIGTMDGNDEFDTVFGCYNYDNFGSRNILTIYSGNVNEWKTGQFCTNCVFDKINDSTHIFRAMMRSKKFASLAFDDIIRYGPGNSPFEDLTSDFDQPYSQEHYTVAAEDSLMLSTIRNLVSQHIIVAVFERYQQCNHEHWVRIGDDCKKCLIERGEDSDYHFCSRCKKFHGNNPCQDDDIDVDLRAILGGGRNCPFCKKFILKSEACNHIACRCGGHFCYVCGEGFDNSKACYSHLTQEHGGYWTPTD